LRFSVDLLAEAEERAAASGDTFLAREEEESVRGGGNLAKGGDGLAGLVDDGIDAGASVFNGAGSAGDPAAFKL
jgi:hypothetical protein